MMRHDVTCPVCAGKDISELGADQMGYLCPAHRAKANATNHGIRMHHG